jgi:hypothetical protein
VTLKGKLAPIFLRGIRVTIIDFTFSRLRAPTGPKFLNLNYITSKPGTSTTTKKNSNE